jgi:cell division transport system permease protein
VRTLIYASQSAFKNLWHEKWINLLTVLSLGVSIFVMGIFLLMTLNVQRALTFWVKDYGIIVYLEQAIDAAKKKALIQKLSDDPDFEKLRFISKEKAMEELKLQLEQANLSFDYVDSNPLPESIELSFHAENVQFDTVMNKVSQIQRMPGVDDVNYGKEWLFSLSQLSEILNVIGLFLGVILFVATTFVTYTTIKIQIYRRYEEIQTLKLLGATKGYIIIPFMLEGLVFGVIGGLAGVIALYGSYLYLMNHLTLPLFHDFFVFIPIQWQAILPCASALITCFGVLIAVGKIRY